MAYGGNDKESANLIEKGENMISQICGLFHQIIYKIKFGKKVSFDAIPSFISHMSIYVQSGNVKIGKHFVMKEGVYMAAVHGGKIVVGDNVSLNRNCMLVCHDMISIGDNCAVGPNTVFYDHDHKFDENGIAYGFKTTPVVIEKNCWIGAGVTILRGTHIGEGSVIGAGSVVRGDIPPHSLVTSNRELNIVPIVSKET